VSFIQLRNTDTEQGYAEGTSEAPVRTDVSEERITSIIRVTIICELGTLAVTGNLPCCEEIFANVVLSSLILVTLMIKAIVL
jgi:hypothetical protein